MADLQKEVKGLKKQVEDLKKDLKTKSKAFFKEHSKILFNEHPNLKSFSWAQYTPYFNDGDSCEFGASTDSTSIKVNDIEYYDTYDYVNEKKKVKKEYKDIVPLFEIIGEFLSNFDDEILEEMFGDHAEITVTVKGIKVTEYEHD